MSEPGSARISPTAHYTGFVWYRNGLSHPAFMTREGWLLHNLLRPMNVGYRLQGRADLDTMLLARHRAYRERVKQCEALGEYAIAEDVREILRQEQEHQIDLATALGEDVPDVSVEPSKPTKHKR